MSELVADSPIGGQGELPFLEEIEPLVLDGWQVNTKLLMVQRRNLGLGAEMGMGKTPPALKALEELDPPSCMIIVTKRALIGWRRMMRQWFPEMFKKYQIIIKRDTATRKAQWALGHPFVITTWDWFLRDQKYMKRRNFSQMVVDEAHKYIRSRKTKTFDALSHMEYLGIFIITGSPVSKGAEQFWTYLHLMNPKLFSSYWKWVNTFCIVIDGPFGKEVHGTKNLDSLQQVLRQYFVLLRKEDVGRLKKRRMFLEAVMTPEQSKAYNKMRDDMYLELEDGELLVAATPMTVCLRLRQLLCCPAILDPRLGIGGGLEAIIEELKELSSDDQHTVIFTPFRAAVPIISEAIRTALNKPTFEFMGGLEPDKLEARLAQWRKQKGVGVCVIKYAESFDMETCDKGFFLGYEWDPYENYQAEDRVDRRNNLNPYIRMFYTRMQGTYDEDVMSVLVHKAVNLNAIYGDHKKLKMLLSRRIETVN